MKCESRNAKACIRQARERQNETRKAGYRQAEEKKALEVRERQQQEERDRQRIQAVKDRKALEDFRDSSKVDPKSRAKAAGLKSTFILENDHLLMTSFGRGNRAVLEKDIVEREVLDINPQGAFKARPERERYLLFGRVPDASTDDPLYKAEDRSLQTGEDLIHCKGALEQRFFGCTFEDNIHIQMIYNILDMEKLLTVHINNIIYALTNLLRENISNYEDFIGSTSWHNNVGHDYDSFVRYCKDKDKDKSCLLFLFQKLARQKQLGYYGLEVTKDAPPKHPCKDEHDVLRVTEAEFYMMVFTLGQLRQGLAHGRYRELTRLYSEKGFNTAAQAVMDHLYCERIERLNANFVSNAKTDLVLLFRAFEVKDAEAKKAYVRDYYDFIIRKEYKNQGFSVKILREAMTRAIDEAMVIREQRYDTFRYKINRCIDFAIYRYYMSHPGEAQAMIDALRAGLDEDAKLDVYSIEARRIWPALRELVLNHILIQMSDAKFSAIREDRDVSPAMLEGILLTTEATSFSKLIYMMTIFMDGKEINDLLTSLISKLENIGSFIDVLRELNLNAEFSKDYRLFAQSWRVAGELRIINSFARMRRESPASRKQMFIEAARVLREGSPIEALEAYWDEKLDKKPGADGVKKEMGVRNFIINNVINSQRFRYLARYANIENVSRLADSKPLVAFVLREIPDDQIQRYYAACYGHELPYDPAMREALTERLTGFSFEELRDVRNDDQRMDKEEREEKRRRQALVRLYLTVLYQAVKNLVYVNSRYFMAFHCVERDRILLDPDKWDISNAKWQAVSRDAAYGYNAFAHDFLRQYPARRSVQRYLDVNYANSDATVVRVFRNKVEHLGAVRVVAL